jgi:hypothetical protein
MRKTIVIHRSKDNFIKTKGECNIHLGEPIIVSNKDISVEIDAGIIYSSNGEKSEKEVKSDELDFLLTDFGMSYSKRRFLIWLFNLL